MNRKLSEEVDEYQQDNNIEELADILEVIYAIVKAKGYELSDFENVRKSKATERGAFDRKIFLEYIED